MSTKDFISSGNIELYVLGMLSEEESVELLGLAAAHPEVRAALDLAEEDMRQMDTSLASPPPVGVKASLFQQLSKEETPVIPLQQQKLQKKDNYWMKFLVAAMLSLTVMSSFLAYNYYQQWQQSEGRYATLQARNESLADQVLQTNTELETKQSYLSAIVKGQTKEITLAGLPYQPGGLAKVYFNPNTADVFLSVSNLLPTQEDQDYQLWAIIDGQPVDIGIVDMAEVVQKMKGATGASAFAITLEPKGGSASPTLDQMVVLGVVES